MSDLSVVSRGNCAQTSFKTLMTSLWIVSVDLCWDLLSACTVNFVAWSDLIS
jgi:hypothetical protein